MNAADAGGGDTSRKDLALALGAVVLLAAALRVPHLDYGLPGTTYVDGFRFVEEAREMASAPAGWEPNDVIYPGLLKFILSWIYGGLGIHGRTGLYLTPRVVATLFDLGTVAAVFALARRMSDRYGALLGAALHAVSIVAVTSSRVETADSGLAFFLTAALWVLTTPGLRLAHFAIGGLLVGCAMGMKYSGVYGFLALGFGAWLARREGAARAGGAAALGGAIAAGVFLASTPWIVSMFAVYKKGFELQAEVQRYGQIGHVQSSAFDYLVSPAVTCEQPWLPTSLLHAVGPLVLAAGLAAVVFALAGKMREPARLCAIFVVVEYVLVSGEGHVKAIRYLLPVLPALAALTGAAVAEACARRAALRRPVAQVAIALALLALPAARTLRYLDSSARTMTNDLALAWARANLPRGAVVLLSPFYLDTLRSLDLRIMNLAGAAQNQYRAQKSVGVDTEAKPLFRPELLDSARRAGIEYFVLNSYFESAYYDTAENRRWFPKTVASYAAFRERLEREADLLYEVRGHDEGRLGPDVRVYRLRPAAP